LVPALGELSEAASRPQTANLSTGRSLWPPCPWSSFQTPADLRKRLEENASDLLGPERRRGQWVIECFFAREDNQRAKEGRAYHGDKGRKNSFSFSDVSGIQFMGAFVGAPLFANASPTFFNLVVQISSVISRGMDALLSKRF
jgi:hypothetical protein